MRWEPMDRERRGSSTRCINVFELTSRGGALRIPEIAEQSVLVTGAARGLGLAMANRLARLGATVALVDIDTQSVAAAVARIRSDGGRAYAYTADVSSQAAFSQAAG